MRPSEIIINDAQATFSITDQNGRRLQVRRITALDTLRLVKAAGPELSQNGAWLSMAGLAFSVTEIEGIPVPPPVSEAQIERLVDRLGDEGLAAIAAALDEQPVDASSKATLGNLHGTQS